MENSVDPEKQHASASLRVFAVLAAYLILVKLTIVFQPDLFRSAAQSAVFEWPFLALWIGLGSAGCLMAAYLGFPAPFPKGFRVRVFLWPLVLGVLLGVVAIITDVATGWTAFVAAQMKIPSIHIVFPASALIYPGGAIIVNILYRIFAVPLLLWIISTRLLHGRAQTKVYWILSAILSLAEPLGDLGLVRLGIATMVVVFLEDYFLNLAESYLFRKLGFLAPILLRIFFYLIWHVLWGYLQQK